MLNLNGVLTVKDVTSVQQYTRVRLQLDNELRSAEALALHEQRYLPDDVIKKLSEDVYGIELSEPLSNYIPEDIVTLFRNTGAVPVSYFQMTQEVTAVYLPERQPDVIESMLYKITCVPTTLYYFLDAYQELYGRHPLLKSVPAKEMFTSITQEAITYGAADITISTVGKKAEVYYNVRKKKVYSNRLFLAEDMQDLITYLCISSPYLVGTRTPKYVDVDLDANHRGRVVINAKFKGYVITIRVLPNKVFNQEVTELGLTAKTATWLQSNLLDRQPGLRVIVGETMSGKNTTALALLQSLVSRRSMKIVSVEMPVEQELPGVEQIDTETVEEYKENIESLIHQNPDFVYITEMRDSTGLSTVRITNTGKCVLSTLHANSVADAISRLMDITGLEQDRVIQTIHSIVHQRLIRDEVKDIVYPRNRYVRLSDDLKYRLYGKSLGEVIKILREEEDGDAECDLLQNT